MNIDIKAAERAVYDLCIAGAGPAGIILALEYQKLRPEHHVLLIEYGPRKAGSHNLMDDSIQIADARNHHLPCECTNKGLGGSSASWGGRCVMYDEIDFLQREILKGECTWDLSLFHEAQKHASRAADYFECGKAEFDLQEVAGFEGRPIAENFKNGDVTDTVIERYSMPTRFGSRYRHYIDSSANLHLLEGWEACQLAMHPNTESVAALGVRDFARLRQATIKARKFVLAAGAQETTRLLLKNPGVFQNRAGIPGSLGKYYQGHISGKIASVRFYGDPRKTDYAFRRTPEGVYLRRRFQLSQKALLEHNLLNTALWLDNPLYMNPEHRNGAMSLMYLAMITPGLGKKLAPPAIAHSITKGKATGIPQHLGNVVRDFPKSLTIPAATFFPGIVSSANCPECFYTALAMSMPCIFMPSRCPLPKTAWNWRRTVKL